MRVIHDTYKNVVGSILYINQSFTTFALFSLKIISKLTSSLYDYNRVTFLYTIINQWLLTQKHTLKLFQKVFLSFIICEGNGLGTGSHGDRWNVIIPFE